MFHTLNKLNSVGDNSNKKPVLRQSEMKFGHKYKIFSSKVVTTSYGEQILLELEENHLFLPNRYLKQLNTTDIDALGSGNFIIKNNGPEGQRFKLEFEIIDETPLSSADCNYIRNNNYNKISRDGIDTVDNSNPDLLSKAFNFYSENGENDKNNKNAYFYN